MVRLEAVRLEVARVEVMRVVVMVGAVRGVTCWMACEICEPNFCRLPTNSELASADVVVAAGGSAAAAAAVLAESMGR